MSAMSMSSFLFKYDLSELHNPTQDPNHQHLLGKYKQDCKSNFILMNHSSYPWETQKYQSGIESLQLPSIITPEHDACDIRSFLFVVI